MDISESPVAGIPDNWKVTMSVEEAASILGIGRSSAYEAVRRGDLPHLRLGGRILVKSLDLARLLGLEGKAGGVAS